MRFGDSETQRLLRSTARSYLAETFPWERLYDLECGQARLTDADLRGFADLGWLGLLAPESAAGGGASLLDAATVVEEFGYAAVPAPVAAGNIAAYLLSSAGEQDAGAEHLASLSSGSRVYTLSETTRRRGSPKRPAASAARPLRVIGGKLSGTLPLVPFADLAGFVLAPLAIDGEPAFAAISLDGAEREHVKLLDRSGYCNVHFQDSGLDASAVLATGRDAVALHERCDALVTAFLLVELAGMMQRTLEMTTEYISQREQFGQPIGKFQAARHRAAELLMQTETTRWAAYHALSRFQDDPDDTQEIWLAKHWAVRSADRVYQISHLLHGGVGVGMEYPLHLYTQGLAAFAVRGGTMNEMADRTIESLGVAQERRR